MDTLSKVLATLDFDSNFYFSARLNGAWGIAVPAHNRVARFHICCQGTCLFKIDGIANIITLTVGDILIIPHGVAHTMLSDDSQNVIELDSAFEKANYDGTKVFEYEQQSGDANCELLCGHFEFGNSLQHPLTEQLPAVLLILNPNCIELTWLKDALVNYTRDSNLEQPGNDLIIKHLSEIIFTLAVQQWHLQQDKPEGFIAAIADPHLSKTLQSFHDNPQHRWTIEMLAESAHMSRTRFVEHFTATVKMPPIQYITLWRMAMAQRLLRTNKVAIRAIANQCGYESVTAFSKAFKRLTAKTPRQYRIGNR